MYTFNIPYSVVPGSNCNPSEDKKNSSQASYTWRFNKKGKMSIARIGRELGYEISNEQTRELEYIINGFESEKSYGLYLTIQNYEPGLYHHYSKTNNIVLHAVSTYCELNKVRKFQYEYAPEVCWEGEVDTVSDIVKKCGISISPSFNGIYSGLAALLSIEFPKFSLCGSAMPVVHYTLERGMVREDRKFLFWANQPELMRFTKVYLLNRFPRSVAWENAS